MSKEVILDTPFMVFKEENSLSCPQKCKIAKQDISFPANSLIIVKCGEKRILCRVFYLNECYDSKSICFIDDSVQISEKLNEIKYVQNLELIDKSEITEFKQVNIKVYADAAKLDLNIIKTKDNFKNVIKCALKHFSFTSNCTISCDRFGINSIYVVSTSDMNKYGTLDAECILEIEEILIDSSAKWNQWTLGALSDEEKKLEVIIKSNIQFAKDQRKLSTKPSSQVLIYGPSGSGKSSLIHQMSAKFNCNLFEITGDIFKPYPGETEEELQKIFNRITDITNLISSNLSIVLIENIELFCPKVDAKMKENSHSSRIASLIYSYLDKISYTKGIITIGTTSKIELVNIALRRFSRLGVEIALEMPNEIQRYEITKILIDRILKNQIKLNDAEELSRFVAQNTSGFVGADLEILCQHVLRQYEVQNEDFRYLFETGIQKINPSVMRDNLGTMMKSTMSFKNIGGMENIKKSLLTSILGPLKYPEKFSRFGLKNVSGILLYGASGCAKTTIVKCLAGESKMTLLSVSSAEIYSPYVGEAEKFIVKLFDQARLSAPTILFFDEIDTIVGNRTHSDGTNDAHMRILSTLLTEIDGFGGNGNASKTKPVLIVGATNRPECIDDALMRPGRFDKLIHIPAPDYDYRLQILNFLLKQMPIAQNVNVEDIARRTENFSGADLVNLCNEAALCAATRDMNTEEIKLEDFESVLVFLRPSLTKEKIEFYERFERRHSERTIKMVI
jgi:SpoVK/Ycf46/Vps4 family AAA+-type ATPase